MILGVMSIVSCGVLGPIAWVMGRRLRADAEAAGVPEPGLAKAGRICGMVGTALLVLQVAWGIFVITLLLGGGLG